MALYNFDALRSTPPAADLLAALSDAIGDTIVPAAQRVLVAASARSPEEGLALLGAYVTIENPMVRQTILDLVLAIAAGHPRRT